MQREKGSEGVPPELRDTATLRCPPAELVDGVSIPHIQGCQNNPCASRLALTSSLKHFSVKNAVWKRNLSCPMHLRAFLPASTDDLGQIEGLRVRLEGQSMNTSFLPFPSAVFFSPPPPHWHPSPIPFSSSHFFTLSNAPAASTHLGAQLVEEGCWVCIGGWEVEHRGTLHREWVLVHNREIENRG